MTNGWNIKSGSGKGLHMFWPQQETPEPRVLPGLINGRCININKSEVSRKFDSVFGYSYTIDPRKQIGRYVQKSDENARHDGVILHEPTEPREGYVYQIVINNQISDEMVEDLRIIFMRGVLPFFYRKIRPIQTRFANTNTVTTVEETDNFFDEDEVRKVCSFCELMGLDYGELDCLRDRSSGRLYIVDVNRTPFGPPNGLSKSETDRAVRDMAAAFKRAFPLLS